MEYYCIFYYFDCIIFQILDFDLLVLKELSISAAWLCFNDLQA